MGRPNSLRPCRTRVLGQGDLRHRVVLLGAEYDADGLRLMVGALEAVEEVHVHLHLSEVLVRELAELEIDEHEAAKQAVVEDEVDVEVIAFERHTLLPGDEAEALAQLEEAVNREGGSAIMVLARENRAAEITALSALFAPDANTFSRGSKFRDSATSITSACGALGELWVETQPDDSQASREQQRLDEEIASFEAEEKILAADAAAHAEKIADGVESIDSGISKNLREMAKRVRDTGLRQYAAGATDSPASP